MKIAFTTLACPAWDLDTIIRRAVEYGYDGVDFRGLQEELDVTKLPEFTTAAAKTRRKFADGGLHVSGISSSINLCVRERAAEFLEEARRTIGVARALDCRHVRVFGGGDVQRHTRQELVAFGRELMQAILALDGAAEVTWALETHDNWIHSGDFRMLFDAIGSPQAGILWDMGHTPRFANEPPAETMSALGAAICYTHIKDAMFDPQHALAMEDGWRYVPPGTGALPLAECIVRLKAQGYDGWCVFEHEKRWIPALPEPEEALPQCAAWLRSVI